MCQSADGESILLCPRCMKETQEPIVWQPKWRKMRMRVLVRDCFRCQYPGCTCDNLALLTIHHIKPKSQGGKSKFNNLTTMCQYHHALTHDMLPKKGDSAQHDLSGVHEFVGVVCEALAEVGD